MSGHGGSQLKLDYKTIDATTVALNYFEIVLQFVHTGNKSLVIRDFCLLIVSIVVPLYDCVFDLADATQITVNFRYFIRNQVVSVFIIGQHVLLSRRAQTRMEPLHTAQVQHSLHARKIDSELYSVALAYLSDGLDVGPAKHFVSKFFVPIVGLRLVFKVVFLSLKCLFVAMHPH